MAKKKSNSKKTNEEEKDVSVIYDSEMSDEMRQSYIDYAMQVIKSRALPDVRDGLKPVHRRILHAMNELGLNPDSNYRKSARVVGDVLGKYHPHGDSAVYLAMVRMSQPFKNNLVLVDGHGNFGSIDGDSPAHMRYTEVKMTQISTWMLDELKYDVVDFKNNFDDTEKEPSVLPNKLPGLLINGTNGVAVGMATNIPTHNPVEVIDAYMAFIDNNDISIDRLCEYIPAPDFPTGGIIVNADEFRSKFYYKGEASLRVRSKYHIEDIGYGKKNIVITEVPYTISGSINKQLISPILDMIVSKKLDECSEIREESNKEGLRIVIETKRGVNMDKLIKKLLAKTAMEDSSKYRFLALNANREPICYNLRTYFEDVLKFQKEFYTRKYQKILATSELRKEILEGYITAHTAIQVIVDVLTCTEANTQKEADALVKNTFMYGDVAHLESTSMMKKHIKIAKGFRFTERQVKSIMYKPLVSLMRLQVEKYKAELEEVNKTIAECQSIITNEKELHKVIKKELRVIKKEVAYERKTSIDNIDKASYKESIKVEDLLVLIDNLGYLKILDVPKNFNIENYAEFKYVNVIKNTDSLRFFTNKGNFIQLRMFGLEKTKNKDRGRLIETYIDLPEDEKILLYEAQSEILKKDLLILTQNGFLKRMDGIELDSTYANIAYTKFDEGDSIVDIQLVDRDLYYDLKVFSANNISKTIDKADIKFAKKGAKGNRALKGIESSYMTIIPKDPPELEEEEENIQEMFLSFDLEGNIEPINILDEE